MRLQRTSKKTRKPHAADLPPRHPDCRGGCDDVPQCGCRGLSRPSRQDRRAVPGRRLQRHRRPHPGAKAFGKDRTAVLCREPRRGRRQYRRRNGGERFRGRLHAIGHCAAAAHHQHRALQEPAVRSGHVVCAGGAARHRADRADGAPVATREERRRIWSRSPRQNPARSISARPASARPIIWPANCSGT